MSAQEKNIRESTFPSDTRKDSVIIPPVERTRALWIGFRHALVIFLGHLDRYLNTEGQRPRCEHCGNKL